MYGPLNSLGPAGRLQGARDRQSRLHLQPPLHNLARAVRPTLRQIRVDIGTAYYENSLSGK